jgi:hypothetical protein
MRIDISSYLTDQWHRALATPRGRIIIFISLPVIVFTIWLYGVYHPINIKIIGAEFAYNELLAHAAQINTKTQEHIQQKCMREALAQKWHTYAAPDNTLPTSYLMILVQKAGLQLESCIVNSTITKEWYTSEHVTLHCCGSFDAIKTFFTALQQRAIAPTCQRAEITTNGSVIHFNGEFRCMTVLQDTHNKNPST